MLITELLQRVHAGDKEALNSVVPLVYDELKKLAAGHLRREASAAWHSAAAPFDTTALVHEAFIRLAGGAHPSYENRAHFYGIASRLMRQILVDSARARAAAKRDVRLEVTIAGLPEVGGSRPDESLLAMDRALDRLAEADPMRARLIEMRFFGGMTAEETAAALSMSVHTVRRELRLAQAWLFKEMAE